MKPFASASGGDWSLRVDAALFLTGTTGALVEGCSFYGVGGNAVLLYAYNRGARVEGEETDGWAGTRILWGGSDGRGDGLAIGW